MADLFRLILADLKPSGMLVEVIGAVLALSVALLGFLYGGPLLVVVLS